MTPEKKLIDEVVDRIIKAVAPRRILLFGSGARGEAGARSDLDLLIIVSRGAHRRETAGIAYQALYDLPIAKDIVVVTEEDIERYADEPSLVICPALREGKEIYRAA